MTDDTKHKSEFRIEPMDIGTILAGPRPTLEFVLPGILRGTVGVIVGPGSVGKSWFLMQIFASMAVGRDVWGLIGESPNRPEHVALIAAEDPPEVLASRIYSIGTNLKEIIRASEGEEAAALAVNDLAQRFRVLPSYGQRLVLMNSKGQVDTDVYNAMRAVCEDGYGLVGIDTLRRVHDADENDNSQMAALLGQFEGMTRVGRHPSVLINHHTSKGASRDGRGDEPQAARGAAAITDNARFQANLLVMSHNEAETCGIEDDAERRRWVRYSGSKINYAASGGDAWLYRGPGGVLERRAPPKAVRKNGVAQSSRKRGTF